jgi:hypothetical protein
VPDIVRDVPLEALARARRNVADVPELSNLVRQAREEGQTREWLTDHLAVRLSAMWGGKDYQEAEAAARIVAHDLLGSSPVIVTDRVTGQTIAQLPEDAVWQPEAVPREDGSLANPMARLRPEIEAQLLEQVHDRAREVKIVEQALATVATTQLIRDEGSRMLDILTHEGRQRVVEEIRQGLVESCIHYFTTYYQGLGDLRLNVGLQRSLYDFKLTHTLSCEATLKIPDRTTVNVRHDWAARSRQVMARDLIYQVAEALRGAVYLDAATAQASDAVLAEAPLRLIPDRLCGRGSAVRKSGISRTVRWENPVINVLDPCVQIVLDPETLKVQSAEFNDKLIIRASLDADIQFDTRGVRAFNVPVKQVEAVAVPVR